VTAEQVRKATGILSEVLKQEEKDME
jgi:hypothetical protein